MTDDYVFDTEALVAFLYDEPGHDVVAKLLDPVFQGDVDGAMTAANASEIFYLVARFEGDDENPTRDSLRIADRDVRTLERRGLEIQPADWRFAGECKAFGGCSIVDAHAVALAHERDASLVAGADDDFEELPFDVDVRRFRDEAV